MTISTHQQRDKTCHGNPGRLISRHPGRPGTKSGADQLRSYILTEELLQLPAQFVLLRADVDELKSGQGRLETRMNRAEGRLGNIEGYLYEERALNRILARATRLDIEGGQIAFAKTGQARQDFHEAMSTAVRTGVISQDEYEDLAEADLVIRGRNRRHAVVEISLGPDEDDLSRALRRSEILHRATREHVSAVIATPDPHPSLIGEAEGRSVLVLGIPA